MPIHIPDTYRDTAFASRQTGLLFNLPQPDPEHEQLPEGISLCMIVKNEERFLKECLESVKDVVDEINIVDTGSTDRTVEIARSYGAKIEFREWRNDFSWARNEALEMATRRWTLILDADEELERESFGLVNSLRTTPAGMTGVYVNIVNVISDSAGMGTMSHRLIRLFPTNKLIRYKGVIHETIHDIRDGQMPSVLSPITILHKGYTAEMLSAREKDSRNKPLVDRAYEENGDDTFSLFNFGNTAICAGNVDVGIEVLERMLATATRVSAFFPLAYLMLGQTYTVSRGEPEKALEILDTGLEKFPLDAGLVFCRGQVLAKLNRIAEAREAYEKALEMREVMAIAAMTDEELFEWKIFYAMAGLYEHQGDFARAIELVDQALGNKPNAYHLLQAKARLEERAGNFFDAESLYRRIAADDKQRGILELTNFLLRRHRFGEAIAIIENEGLSLNPDVLARLNVAAARASLDSQRGDAMPFIEAALRLSPGNGFAISLMERLLTERGDIDGLLKLHAEELRAPCVRAEDFARRSVRLLALQRSEEALAAADAGLQLEPENSELRFNAGAACLNLGDDERARFHFSRVAPSSPEAHAEAMRLLSALLLKSGDAAGALHAGELYVAALGRETDAVLRSASMLVNGGARAEGRKLLEANVGIDQRIALELAGMLLQDGDIAGAGRVAAASLK